MVRFRLLNNRARLVLLHDFRLFAGRMHYIWKRLVNVLFVRQYEDSGHRRMRNSSTAAMQPMDIWFELSTVPFPLSIGNIFVSRQLDYWHQGRYRRGGGRLFPDKTRSLEGAYSVAGKYKFIVW